MNIDTLSPLLLKMAITLTKLFAKRCFRGSLSIIDIKEDLSGSGIELLGDALEKRRTHRNLEHMASEIARSIRPTLAAENAHPGSIRIKSVLLALNTTLESVRCCELFLENRLDPVSISRVLISQPTKGDPLSGDELQLYNRTLEELVRYIVPIVDELPHFLAHSVDIILRNIDKLSHDVERVLSSVIRIEKSNVFAKDFGRFEKDYREAIVRRYDTMELFGADISQEAKRHSLSVAYISLNVQQIKQSRPISGSESVEERSASVASPVELVLDNIHKKGRKLLIRGEAGSGKSTLFRWIAVRAAEQISAEESLAPNDWEKLLVESPSEGLVKPSTINSKMGQPPLRPSPTARGTRAANEGSWRHRLPFLIKLRDCDKGHLPSPHDFPSLIVSELDNPPTDWVNSVLVEGRGVILLDGIDEVPGADREKLRANIVAIIQAYPLNMYILSTRPLAVPENWLESENFSESRINPLSNVDRELFIYKWHKSVEDALDRVNRREVLTSLAKKLIDALVLNPEIARLGTNPLLCAMICALHRDRNKHLPRDLADLCESLCHMLLERREAESQLSDSVSAEPYRRLGYEQRRLIVRALAHQMSLRGFSTFPKEAAEAIVEKALVTFPGSVGQDRSTVLQALIERSGMLREAKPEHLDFIHNTFKEFLAAEVFAEQNDVDYLAEHAIDPQRQPVILFAVGTRKENFANNLITRILDDAEAGSVSQVFTFPPKPKAMKSINRDRYLLALRCRSMALQLSPLLIQRLDALTKTLFPPKDASDALSFATLGDGAIAFLDRRSRNLSTTLATIQLLNLIGTPAAKERLRDFRGDSRIEIVTELSRAINPIEIAAVIDFLKEDRLLPFAIAKQIKDLSPIAGRKDIYLLNLTSLAISDFTPIGTLVSLRTLYLTSTKIIDLQPLSNLKQLEWLDLRYTKVSDLSPLSSLDSLETLNLRGTDVTNLNSLKNLKRLRSIDLVQTSVNDLTPLRELPLLEDVWMSHRPIGILNLDQVSRNIVKFINVSIK